MNKTVEQSKTEHIQIIMAEHINGYDRLFGGRLMEWIDIVAGVVARRHTGMNVTTVCVDNLVFKAAAKINELVLLTGRVTYVGNTSLEVRVDTYVEHGDGTRNMVNRAYIVMVALDENERPAKVPGLIMQTEAQRLEWEAGEKRAQLRKQRRIQGY